MQLCIVVAALGSLRLRSEDDSGRDLAVAVQTTGLIEAGVFKRAL